MSPAELELLFQTSSYQADEDLVFAHPHSGRPIDRSLLLKRFKAALTRARRARDPLSRLEAYLRDADGGRGRPDADPSGVDGPPRLARRR